MNRLALVLLLVGCSADAATTLAGAPENKRIGAHLLPGPALTACCHGELCVMPRFEQRECDPGMTPCPSNDQLKRIDAIGPLWECRS